MEAWVSTKRVNAFLQLKELNLAEYYIESAHQVSSRDRLCSDGSSVEEEPRAHAAREGAVNISELSYHYFSPTGSVSGAATSCAISVHRGSFTWSREEQGSGPDTPRSPDTAEGGEDGTIPWGLTNINITIKSVS